jgi:uncharacterized protein (TIGR03437 family)
MATLAWLSAGMFATLCWFPQFAASQTSGITQFGDKATWQNASKNITSISFDGLGGTVGGPQYPDQQYSGGLTISGVTFSPLPSVKVSNYLYVRTAVSDFLYGAGDTDLGCLQVHGPCGSGAGISVSLPPGTTSVGLDLAAFWVPGAIVTFSGNTAFSVPNAPPSQQDSAFVGFISSTPFQSITVRAAGLPIIRSFSLGNASGSTAPFLSSGGITPLDSYSSGTIQPGGWVTLWGNNLASETAAWNGDFPTILAGTSVTINGKAAYLSYVGPRQINLQVPDDSTFGAPVPVVVTTPAGVASTTVILAPLAPSLALLDATRVAGIILRQDGSGAYGGGSYDILGPTGNTLGYPTKAAQAGDIVELFGVGFGPTSPFVPAGQAFAGVAPSTDPVRVTIGSAPATAVNPLFSGLSSAGLFQINLTIPAGAGSGDVPILATVGNTQTQAYAVISLH